MMTRRDMLKATLAGSAALSLPSLTLAQGKGPFELAKLPYAFDALEPHIDARTMEIHHGKHHRAYVDNLNKAVAGTEWASKPIEELLKNLDKVPEKIRMAVRNNGGGHWNHTMFWKWMTPKSMAPRGDLADAIKAAFGDLDKMLAALKQAGLTRFGSGWAWLNVGKDGKLVITSSPNQDNPVMDGSGTPILGVDVWEHAYYLKYQYLRAPYLDAFFKVINWEEVAKGFAAAKKG